MRKKLITALTLILTTLMFLACFSACAEKKYTVKFVNGDEVLQTITVAEGKLPEYTGLTPTKEADDDYRYEFAGWDKEIKKATKNVTYTAVFNEIAIFDVTFKNYDNTWLTQITVDAGTTPEYTGETPTKPDTVSHEFVHSGWVLESDMTTPLGAIYSDATYIATFEEIVKTFTVTFKAAGEQYDDAQQVAYGSFATAPAEAPTTTEANMIFDYWTVDGVEVDLTTYEITEATEFVAVFKFNWDALDFTQNIVPMFTGNVGINDTQDFGFIGGYAGDLANNWIYISESEGVVTKINMMRTGAVDNRLFIEKEYVANAIAKGYTELTIVYKWDTSNGRQAASPTIKAGVGDSFAEIGATYAYRAHNEYKEIEGTYIRTYDLTDFDTDNCLIIDNDGVAPNVISIYEISFGEYVAPDLSQFTGNIAGIAADNGIVSAKFNTSDNNNKLYDSNETTIFNVGRNGKGHMLFDMSYVKAQYEKGLTSLKITFSVATSQDIWAKFGLGYYDASAGTSVSFGTDFQCSYATTSREYPETYIWTITPEMWSSLDIAGGDMIGIIDLQAGEQPYSSMTITHLEFLNASAQA